MAPPRRGPGCRLDADNAASFWRQLEVDGALVGSGMETAEGFLRVLEAFYAVGGVST